MMGRNKTRQREHGRDRERLEEEAQGEKEGLQMIDWTLEETVLAPSHPSTGNANTHTLSLGTSAVPLNQGSVRSKCGGF